jgi:general secretion pathway protein N
MVMWRKILVAVALSGGLLTTGPSARLLAATSATLDILPGDRAGEAGNTVDLGSVRPIAQPNREAGRPLPSGNPLWAVPLSVLSATRDRPIFSASRRPPQRAVVAPQADQASVPAAPKPAGPEHPPLALIGAVVGDDDAIAVFIDRTDQKIFRLRQGEMHGGWMLSAVLRREVTLKKADRTEVLGLQRPDGPAAPAAAAAPALGVPVAGAADGSYAPFIPRSTPKHGEPDGL